MSVFQFLRLETFGVRARSGEPDHRCIAGVIGELQRLTGHCSHVANPCAQLIYGDDPQFVGEIAKDQARRSVDKRGHKLRADGAALVAAVVSYPFSTAEVMADPDSYDRYIHWRNQTVEWSETQFGDSLKAIVEHRDEAYPHLHLLVLPGCVNGVLDFSRAHPGIHAQQAVALSERTKAYNRAMKALLDGYHGAVSCHFNIARKGANKLRVDRRVALANQKVHQAEQKAMQIEHEAEYAAIQTHDRLDRELQAIERQQNEIAKSWNTLQRRDSENLNKIRRVKAALQAERVQQLADRNQLDQDVIENEARSESLRVQSEMLWAKRQQAFASVDEEEAWLKEKLAEVQDKRAIQARNGIRRRA